MDEWLPRIQAEVCIGCGECIARCPTHALGQRGEKAALTHPERCTYCALCEEICPVNAIELPYMICFAEKELPHEGETTESESGLWHPAEHDSACRAASDAADFDSH